MGNKDNAPVHTAVIAIAAINDSCFEMIQHPPLLAWSRFIRFPFIPKVQKAMSEPSQSDDDIIHAVEDFLNSQEKDL